MRRSAGFTLLEVMVAVTILGLGLTMILSSQAGLFASTQRVQHEAIVSNLLRCKMSELEVRLLTLGYPLTDEIDSGDCCEDEDNPSYSCKWKIETVELPQPAALSDNNAADGSSKDKAASSPLSALSSGMMGGLPSAASGLGALGTLSSIQDTEGDNLGKNASADDLASSFKQTSAGGPMGLASVAMGLVYPALKPMLEASIRKLTVQVIWREGTKEREFTVSQFVTDPRVGSLNPNAAAGLDAMNQMLNPQASGSTGSSGSSTPASGATK